MFYILSVLVKNPETCRQSILRCIDMPISFNLCLLSLKFGYSVEKPECLSAITSDFALDGYIKYFAQ